MDLEDIKDRLVQLDEDAYLIYGKGIEFKVVLVGGSALSLLGYLNRPTLDIDTLDFPYSLRQLLVDYDVVNNRVSAFINSFPYQYETRLIRLNFGGKCISFYIVSLEDIVISKLYSPRLKDQIDIENEEVLKNINWDLLECLAYDENEAKMSALNDFRYYEFLDSYERYKKRFKK